MLSPDSHGDFSLPCITWKDSRLWSTLFNTSSLITWQVLKNFTDLQQHDISNAPTCYPTTDRSRFCYYVTVCLSFAIFGLLCAMRLVVWNNRLYSILLLWHRKTESINCSETLSPAPPSSFDWHNSLPQFCSSASFWTLSNESAHNVSWLQLALSSELKLQQIRYYKTVQPGFDDFYRLCINSFKHSNAKLLHFNAFTAILV